MPPVKKSSSTKKQNNNILEGFTYEELPDKGEIEIPQEIVDNSIVIDVQDEKPVEEEKVEESKKESTSTIELSNIKIKEPEPKPIFKKNERRNASRKIKMVEYEVNSENLNLDDHVSIQYKPYADIVKTYIFKGIFLNITYLMRDNDSLSNEDLVAYFNKNLPDNLGKLINIVLDAHRTIESISGLITAELLISKEDSADQMIEILLELEIKFPGHTNLYVSTDKIIIPA